MPNDWTWLYQICVNPEPTDLNGSPIDRNDWKFCPGRTGEPWVSYAIASHILRIGVDAIRKKSVKTRKHPAFAGLILLTDFDAIPSGKGGDA